MKKGKNIVLLIGIICNSIVILWAVINSFVNRAHIASVHYQSYGDMISAVIMLLLMLAPVILLIRNLQNKTGKILPIVSILISCAGLLSVVPPAVPQYLIVGELGLIDTYLTMFLSNGGLFLIIGYVCLVIGGILSFPRRKNKE